MNKDLTLSDIFQFILSKLKLILIFGIIAAIATFAFVKVTADLKYNYYGSMLIDPLSNKGENEGYNSNAQMSEVNIVKTLMPTYMAVLQSNDFGDYIAKNVKKDHKIDITKKQVVAMLSYSYRSDELYVYYQCTSTDKKTAYAVAKTINDKTPEYISSLIDHNVFKPVNKVTKDDFTTQSTSAATMAAIAFMVVAVLTIGISLLIELFDTRIKSTENITERFEYPILGKIPDFYANTKNGDGYYGEEKQQSRH